MSLYAVIKGGVVDGIAIADAALETDGHWVCVDGMEPMPGPGWLYEDEKFVQPVLPEPEPPPAPKPIISKVAFRFRMTDAEYVGVINAAKTDVEVAAWVETFNMVSRINLDDQRTKDGVAKLVSKNLLTQARADEILTAPVQPGERA
jgi:hypothetical protein